MTSKIETTKREMYRALAALKAGGRWLLKKQNAEAFETALEEHLEENRHLIDAQRKAYASLHQLKFGISPEQDHANVLKTKAEAMAIARGDGTSALELLNQKEVNRVLLEQVQLLTAELDVLKTANKVAGEELRFAGFKVVADRNLPEGATAMVDIDGKVVGFWRSIPHACEVFVNGTCSGCGRRLVEEA